MNASFLFLVYKGIVSINYQRVLSQDRRLLYKQNFTCSTKERDRQFVAAVSAVQLKISRLLEYFQHSILILLESKIFQNIYRNRDIVSVEPVNIPFDFCSPLRKQLIFFWGREEVCRIDPPAISHCCSSRCFAKSDSKIVERRSGARIVDKVGKAGCRGGTF